MTLDPHYRNGGIAVVGTKTLEFGTMLAEYLFLPKPDDVDLGVSHGASEDGRPTLVVDVRLSYSSLDLLPEWVTRAGGEPPDYDPEPEADAGPSELPEDYWDTADDTDLDNAPR